MFLAANVVPLGEDITFIAAMFLIGMLTALIMFGRAAGGGSDDGER